MSQTTQTTQAAQSQKAKQEKQFSPTVITNFLNNYYRNVALKNPAEQLLTFKVFPTEEKAAAKASQQITIDLYQYQGLLDFIQLYKLAKADKDTNWTLDQIIDRVFDMKLRACLDVPRVFKTNDKTKINAFQEFVVPQLGFNTDNSMNIQDYINGVSSYFAKDDKLKTKIYNLVFPHDSHSADKLPVGVNVIYLQHVSKYHDEVLNLVINKGLEDQAVLESVQKLYANDFDGSDNVKLQLLNPKIAAFVCDPPMVEDNKHKQVIDVKALDKLVAVRMGGTKRKPELVEDDRALTSEEKKAVRALYRELMIVKSFVKIIQGGKNARKVEKQGDKLVAVPDGRTLKECLDKYNEVYGNTQKFYQDWQARIAKTLETIEAETAHSVELTTKETDPAVIAQLVEDAKAKQQYELFLRYFVDAIRFIKNELHYTQPFKTFINDVKKDVLFKFNKNLRSSIDELVEQEKPVSDEQVQTIAEAHYKDWKFINSPKTYDPNDLSIYSKIGKFSGLDVKKEFRVAIGIAIVAFIQEQIALIKAGNKKKKEIQVFIRV